MNAAAVLSRIFKLTVWWAFLLPQGASINLVKCISENGKYVSVKIGGTQRAALDFNKIKSPRRP